jgi:hypothetical protein
MCTPRGGALACAMAYSRSAPSTMCSHLPRSASRCSRQLSRLGSSGRPRAWRGSLAVVPRLVEEQARVRAVLAGQRVPARGVRGGLAPAQVVVQVHRLGEHHRVVAAGGQRLARPHAGGALGLVPVHLERASVDELHVVGEVHAHAGRHPARHGRHVLIDQAVPHEQHAHARQRCGFDPARRVQAAAGRLGDDPQLVQRRLCTATPKPASSAEPRPAAPRWSCGGSCGPPHFAF